MKKFIYDKKGSLIEYRESNKPGVFNKVFRVFGSSYIKYDSHSKQSCIYKYDSDITSLSAIQLFGEMTIHPCIDNYIYTPQRHVAISDKNITSFWLPKKLINKCFDALRAEN